MSLSLPELLLAQVSSTSFHKYLLAREYCSALTINKHIFRYLYPHILASVLPHKFLEVPFNGLSVSSSILFSSNYPNSLTHLLSRPTLMLAAAYSGDLQFMQEVLLHGGDASGVTAIQKNTPIHLAAASGNERVVELLIQKGANVNASNSLSMTPLHYAAQYKNPAATRTLLLAGAQANATTFCQRSPLHYACMHTTSICEVDATEKAGVHRYYSFFRGLNGMKNNDLLALLPIYSYTGDKLQRQVETIKLLLEFHAPPDVSDDRFNPLHYASFFGPVDIVQPLISALLSSPNLSTAQLLDRINSKSNSYITPLIYASAAGHLSIVKLLLSHGAWPIVQHTRTYSALNFALQHNHPEVVAALLEKYSKGADTAGNYILTAIKTQNKEMVQKVVEHFGASKANGAGLISYVICHCNEELALFYTTLFLNNAADAQGDSFSTPLHLAISKNYLDVVRILVQFGANVNVNDGMNRSCLDMTVGPWNPIPNMDIVQILLQKHIININQQDLSGNTVLHRAVTANHLQFVEALVAKGAKLSIKNNKGETPISLAKQNPKIAEYLELAAKKK